ncbi:saccharopine dehydrogenase [Advenella sp. S44]|uniref:Saccharopine dehydrogenase n=1 Tax=Advenella kashmirensis TaxID=310575 RepID=A0A356LB96_9BURK|nr:MULTISPECIES: saccharopine dehydrogenase [unclassified Advenella]PJX20278.1 saccharopine dehydrogenase [Advenella sp. S44]HBP28089.1 saccharopine dehydrogenase [Advenella kashmirensis]
MISDAILLMGGTGAIGRQTASALRSAYPDVPLLIGSRDLVKSRQVANEIGNAEGVVINPQAVDLGLGERRVSAVAVFYADHRLASLRFAHARGVPHLSISSGIYEIAPEVATYMHSPGTAAIVLGYEWLVGATTISVLNCAKPFAQLDQITMNALVDEQDEGGPAVAEDFERLGRMMPAAFTRRGGSYVWRSNDDAKARFRAIDGTEMESTGFSSIDVAGLAAATGASDVQFNLAIGVSSSRRRSEPKSTEIIIEMAGKDRDGHPLRTRHGVFHPGGAAPLTALGVSMILERLAGLDGKAPTRPGLYFPFQVIDHASYLSRLQTEGGSVVSLDVEGCECGSGHPA